MSKNPTRVLTNPTGRPMIGDGWKNKGGCGGEGETAEGTAAKGLPGNPPGGSSLAENSRRRAGFQSRSPSPPHPPCSPLACRCNFALASLTWILAGGMADTVLLATLATLLLPALALGSLTTSSQ